MILMTLKMVQVPLKRHPQSLLARAIVCAVKILKFLISLQLRSWRNQKVSQVGRLGPSKPVGTLSILGSVFALHPTIFFATFAAMQKDKT